MARPMSSCRSTSSNRVRRTSGGPRPCRSSFFPARRPPPLVGRPLAAGLRGVRQFANQSIDLRSVEPEGAPGLSRSHDNPFTKPARHRGSTSRPRSRVSPALRARWANPLGRDSGRALPEGVGASFLPTTVIRRRGRRRRARHGRHAFAISPVGPARSRAAGFLAARRQATLVAAGQTPYPIRDIQTHVGDLDGDKRPEVIDMAEVREGNEFELVSEDWTVATASSAGPGMPAP